MKDDFFSVKYSEIYCPLCDTQIFLGDEIGFVVDREHRGICVHQSCRKKFEGGSDE